MASDPKKVFGEEVDKLVGAGRLAFDLLCGDQEGATRRIGEDVAHRLGRPDIAREIAATAPRKKPPRPETTARAVHATNAASNVIDAEFEEEDDDD